jgi:glycosyltransferase involved in cell wall biosynthesis
MLIGIDASRATAARRTGTENYSLHLIRELVALAPAHRFRLYFNQAPQPGLIPDGAEERVIPLPRLWTHGRLAWEMAVRPPDLLFVPSHVLPLVHPRRSVATVHDLGYVHYPQTHTLWQNTYLRWSTRHNAHSAARVLADSQATRRDLIDAYGIAPRKAVVVYPGRDESLARVADPAAVAATAARYGISGPYLLYVGTLHPRKNLARLVQAFATAAGGLDRGLQLVLAGQKGWMFGEILAQVRSSGMEGRVVFPGYIPEQDLAALLSGALAFVYPSLYEGFGLPVLEAMACGTAVLCSNASSLPEVAGDAALLVDPLDTAALAAGLRRIATDESLRHSLALRGLEQVQRFSWRRCAHETLAVLEEVGCDGD